MDLFWAAGAILWVGIGYMGWGIVKASNFQQWKQMKASATESGYQYPSDEDFDWDPNNLIRGWVYMALGPLFLIFILFAFMLSLWEWRGIRPWNPFCWF